MGTIRKGESCALGKDHLKPQMNKKLEGARGGGRQGEKKQKLKERERKREKQGRTRKTGEIRTREPTITQTL